jgi:dienelactone hydrolase/predicted Ser/Thr protein kinase
LTERDLSQEPTAASPDGRAADRPAPALPAGTRLARFEIRDLLGRGGFGEVYRAHDTRLDRTVALKILRPEVATDQLRERLHREAVAASALHHPGIGTVYDLVEAGGRLLIVMELVEGRTLAEAVSGGPLAPSEAVAVGMGIASALGEAHRAGILHRDVKPANVMLGPGGRVTVLDFGLAKRLAASGAPAGSELTGDGTAVGTLSYMSPEQLLARDVDERSDLFSLGVVLYEMVAGRRPFAGGSALAIADANLHSAPPPVETPAVPERLKGAVRRLLEKDPSRRFASAAELIEELRKVEADLVRHARWRRRRLMLALGTAGALAVSVAGGWFWHRASRARWARETVPTEIARLTAAEEFTKAADLAREGRAVLPDDAALARLWQDVTLEVSFDSVPPGADVSYRPLGAPSTGWRWMGRTPLTKARVPKANHLVRIEKPGFRAFQEIWPGTPWLLRGEDVRLQLDEEGRAPSAMVRVTGGDSRIRIPGLQGLPMLRLPDYWIDQHEVTNGEYARFVEAGGYQRRDLWAEPFVRDGRTLEWDEAMAEFRDPTGRPGPATWDLGGFPKGQEDHPVVGVSWYEAAAYSQFVSKVLPSIYHWSRAAQVGVSHLIVPVSNFAAAGTVAVGGALSGFGTSDMAGNAKEWCRNEAAGGKRYILGGGFGEPTYTFNDADAQSPWERRPNYGFRCIRLEVPPPAGAMARVEPPWRNFEKEKPVSDEVFRAFKGLYAYDRTELDARVEEVETTDEWTRERVSFSAAYGGERVIAHLYLPRNASPPFQTVILFPGSGGMYAEKYLGLVELGTLFPRTGRALLEPIFKGTFERRDGLQDDYPEPTALWRDHVIAWSKDLGRSLDYLEARPEIDRSRFAYFGQSWGAAMAPIMLALEGRFRAAVLTSPGFQRQRTLPEVDAINFITRVRVPTLILGGRYDHFFPEAPTQRPFRQLLGTPARDKRFVLYDVGHTLPRKEVARESIDWLDRHLGPVARE